MNLYKYRPIDKWTLTSLSESTIHFKCPINYNDPFDSKVRVSMEGSDEEWKAYQISNGFTDEKIQTDRAFYSSNDVDEYIDKINVVSELRISCFSETPENILMWSHYADCHKGICLIFNTKKLSLYNTIEFNKQDLDHGNPDTASNTGLIFKVDYSNNMPLPINNLKSNVDEQLKKYILTKSIHWDYEKEWRMVDTIPELKTNNPRYVNNTLTGIIFGLKSSQSDINLVKNVVANQKIDFYQAKASRSEYKVDILPL